MTEILITRKALWMVFTAALLLIAGVFLNGFVGLFLIVVGVAIFFGFVGGEVVKIIFSEFGVFIGVISIILISILFGFISSIFFSVIIGMFIGMLVPTVIIIYNAKAKDFLKRP